MNEWLAQLKHKVWKYLLFDRSYYTTLYADIRAETAWGTWKYSLHHFMAHGMLEGCARRKTLLGFQTLRGLAIRFRAKDNFLSGICVRIKDANPGNKVVVHVFSRRGLVIRLVKSIKAKDAIVPGSNTLQINWQSDPDSAGSIYFVIAVSGARPTRIALEGDAQLIFSPPRSKHDVPVNLCISPVTQCNLNCIHCISRFSRASVSELNDDVWGDIAGLLRSGQIRAISSDYSGDILFSSRRRQPWLDRFIDVGSPMRLDTHANDLTEEVAQKLLRSNVHSINFSLDTMDASQYPGIRKGAISHESVIDNIRNFMRIREELRPDLQVIISFVLMKRNIESVLEAIDLAKELNISFIQGNHLIVMTEDMAEESLALTPQYYNDVASRIHIKARDAGVGLVLPSPFRGHDARVGNAPCRFIWEGAHLLGNGDVMSCCMPGSKMGNVNQASLKEIWNGANYQGFRTKVNSDDPPKICRVCPIYRHQNNYRSYAWGLSEDRQRDFEARCLEASRDLRDPAKGYHA